MKQLGAKPIEVAYPKARRRWLRDGWTREVDHSGEHWYRAWQLKDPKGGDPSEWPEDLRIRQWPEVGRG